MKVIKKLLTPIIFIVLSYYSLKQTNETKQKPTIIDHDFCLQLFHKSYSYKFKLLFLFKILIALIRMSSFEYLLIPR